MTWPTRKTLNARDIRALRLGALILVPVLFYKVVLGPAIRTAWHDRQALVREREALVKDRALVARIHEIADQDTRTTAWLSSESRRLFPGPDEIAATGDLQDYVQWTAEDAGLQLQHTETQPALVVSGSLRAVRLTIRGQGSARTVLSFLATLEHGERLVRIGRFLANHNAGGQPSAGSASESAPNPSAAPVSFTADVYGYALLPPPRGIRVLSRDMGGAYVPLSGRSAADAFDVAEAVTHDPFSLNRGAVEQHVAEAPPAPPPFPIHLVGTVVNDSGDTFAMCEVSGAPPTVVRPGERVAGYTVRTVQRGSIVLVDATGHTTELTLPTPGA